MHIEALLFDLDGTLVDTGELHWLATLEALSENGRSVTREVYDTEVHGGNNEDIARLFFPEDPAGAGLAYVERKEALFRTRLAEAAPMPGLLALLGLAKARGWGTAVVTNAPRANMEATLEAIGLRDSFDTIILGDELERAKPDPLPYRTAMDNLGIRPEHAVAFEDSLPGLASIVASGAFPVGVASGLPRSSLAAAGARLVIDHFLDESLLELVKAE
jgi:HAD superfamily hydrolase (TIGR01509 family)